MYQRLVTSIKKHTSSCGLRQRFFRRLRFSDEFHADLAGVLAHLAAQHALAIALLVLGLTLVGVFLALVQHCVNQPRERGPDDLPLSPA